MKQSSVFTKLDLMKIHEHYINFICIIRRKMFEGYDHKADRLYGKIIQNIKDSKSLDFKTLKMRQTMFSHKN